MRLGHGEGRPVAGVEAGGQVPAQLQVLALVLADRDPVGLVQQDVGGHQHRVGEQPDGRALRAHLGGLVLELGHPLGLPEARQAPQDPAELSVLGDLRLQEDRGLLGVDSGGDHLRRAAERPVGQRGRVGLDGQCMQVSDPVERLVVVLQRHPLPQRPEIVAQVQRVGGGLGQREHPRRTRGRQGRDTPAILTCQSPAASVPPSSSRCTMNVEARRPSSSLTRSSSRFVGAVGPAAADTSALTTSPRLGSCPSWAMK